MTHSICLLLISSLLFVLQNTIAQGMYRYEGKKTKKGNKILAKPFMLHHCYEVLGNEKKWKTRGNWIRQQ
jgi:hypothetical protein